MPRGTGCWSNQAPIFFAVLVAVQTLSICGVIRLSFAGLPKIQSSLNQETEPLQPDSFHLETVVNTSSMLPAVAPEIAAPFRYTICNGMGNQLLQHGAAIALAFQKDMEVEVPGHFIVNGVQASDDPVLPNCNNSVPFDDIFDGRYFLESLQALGVRAKIVHFDLEQPTEVQCAGIGGLEEADPQMVAKVIHAFRPSSAIRPILSSITSRFHENDRDHGICLHHRNGQDWIEHCERWSSIDDGIYRGNCFGETSLEEALVSRGMSENDWIYYCGDEDVPIELKLDGIPILSKSNILTEQQKTQVVDMKPGQPVRDIWSVIDFFACSEISRFVGNSVSTFSALQIGSRGPEHTYWSNSQSIPLADFWRVYQMPIVYTYTERSMITGQRLLQSSILSVKAQMSNNEIHILYHGDEDISFRSWLTDNGVIIHEHHPTWIAGIEEMRKHGDPAASHLFAHSGNYLGTWQRIDIPILMDSEYCLLMDADTLVTRPFTLADFGLNLTRGIAMSSEMLRDGLPSNAGVTVMNIPFLRRTYTAFMNFIMSHVNTPVFNNPSPSDQGAYMEFYGDNITYLSDIFNWKPYWSDEGEDQLEMPFITHFHGVKPNDYMKALRGEQCEPALLDLCAQVFSYRLLCPALSNFAAAVEKLGIRQYCEDSFTDASAVEFCSNFLSSLAQGDETECIELQQQREIVALTEAAASSIENAAPEDLL